MEQFLAYSIHSIYSDNLCQLPLIQWPVNSFRNSYSFISNVFFGAVKKLKHFMLNSNSVRADSMILYHYGNIFIVFARKKINPFSI